MYSDEGRLTLTRNASHSHLNLWHPSRPSRRGLSWKRKAVKKEEVEKRKRKRLARLFSKPGTTVRLTCLFNQTLLSQVNGKRVLMIMMMMMPTMDQVLVEAVSGSEAYRPRLIDSPSLPVNHTMPDGTPITFRCMRHDDVKPFFDALKSAAESGLGYGHDELPNLDFFARNYVDGFHNLVAELTHIGDVVLYCNIGGPSVFARSTDPVIRDGGNTLLTPKYRRRNWYTELSNFLEAPLWRMTDNKIRGYQGDTAVINLRTNLAMTRTNNIVNGILPRGIYFKEQGWVDVVLCFRPCPHSDQVLSKLWRECIPKLHN